MAPEKNDAKTEKTALPADEAQKPVDAPAEAEKVEAVVEQVAPAAELPELPAHWGVAPTTVTGAEVGLDHQPIDVAPKYGPHGQLLRKFLTVCKQCGLNAATVTDMASLVPGHCRHCNGPVEVKGEGPA